MLQPNNEIADQIEELFESRPEKKYSNLSKTILYLLVLIFVLIDGVLAYYYF